MANLQKNYKQGNLARTSRHDKSLTKNAEGIEFKNEWEKEKESLLDAWKTVAKVTTDSWIILLKKKIPQSTNLFEFKISGRILDTTPGLFTPGWMNYKAK